jgi:S1 RNA binding domain protein
MSVEIDSIVEGNVVSIMPFGAFVQIGEGKTGLVHISEVASTYVKDIKEHLHEGDKVKVKVIKIDENGKISLSIKKAQPPRQERAQRKGQGPARDSRPVRPADVDFGGHSKNEELSFEDKLSKFKQVSDENMQALRRSADSKRSGGYRRGGGSY